MEKVGSMFSPRPLGRLLAGCAFLLMLAWLPPAAPARAQDSPSLTTLYYPDVVNVFRVTADVVAPRDAPAEVRFDVVIDYQLVSADDGFLLVFLFEDNVQSSTMNSEQGYKVKLGTGRARMSTAYTPNPGARNVAILVALFAADETLLTWAATLPEQPISLESVPGRVAFTRAMAARNEGNFPEAIRYFTTAIEAAPDNGFFHYWRADSLMRLDDFDNAIADYNQALALLPGDRPSLIGRGVAWLWKDAYQAAAADATSVIDAPVRADQLTAWAYRARGVARAGLGQLAPATADYQAYLSLAPQAPDRPTIERWIEELNLVMSAGGPVQSGTR
jgi:hypothetical protein